MSDMEDTEDQQGEDKASDTGRFFFNLVVQPAETEEFTFQFGLEEGETWTQTETSDTTHLSVPVQETEGSNLLRSTEEPLSPSVEAHEQAFTDDVPHPSGLNDFDSQSINQEQSAAEYTGVPERLPPTDECHLCGLRFRGNFRLYELSYCVDCSRFQDSEFCDTRDYKQPSGPPMNILMRDLSIEGYAD